MKRLASVILILFVGVTALAGCAKKEPVGEWESKSPDALMLLLESKNADTGTITYIDQRSNLLTGAYFYPYIEKTGDELHLRIKFHFYKKNTWLNVSRYLVEIGDVPYEVTFKAGTDRAGYEDIDGDTADIMDILATDDEIEMLQDVALSREAKITAFGVNQQKDRLVSEDEKLVIAEILSAYEQMTKEVNQTSMEK